MKNLIALVIFTLLLHSLVYSQGCLPNGIDFDNQSDIDNFQTNYPGCTMIQGGVYIMGDNINP